MNKRGRSTTPLRHRDETDILRQSNSPNHILTALFDDLNKELSILADNMEDLAKMQSSLSNFNENFASFLYGLNVNAFCTDFPNAPSAESFKELLENK